MKRSSYSFLAFMTIVCLMSVSFSAVAQEEEEASSPVDAGMDIYSTYIWRGAKFGTGPAFQPWVEGSIENLAIGAWGSVNAGVDEAFEMDLYLSYSFDFGLTVGVTDYYFGAVDGDSIGVDDDGETMLESFGYFAFDKGHYIEPMVSYAIGDLSVTAAYMFTPGFEEGDMYFEAGYSISGIDLALGAGDGAYTKDGEFMLCNISIGTSKEIKITDNFSLPLSGAVILNPSTEGFFITAGISF
ncbi:MAG: hypothetical protein JXB49_35230 [Bacteroidales bacterium]|nr:hypothetical protein [Bacteroidales bacterium]